MPKAPGPNRHEIGHAILNHKGDRILLSLAAFRYLDKQKFLRYNRRRGIYEFKRWIHCAAGRVKAIELYQALASVGLVTPIIRELGYDLTGPNAVVCRCHKCRRFIAKVVEAEAEGLTVDQLDEIKRRRKYH